MLDLIPWRAPARSRRPAGLVVVVTGASSGIGRAAALLAAGEGHHLVLVARRAEALDDVAADAEAAGAVSTLVVTADVAVDDDVAALVARTLEEHGRIDAVLHCAGIVAYGRAEDVSPEDFEQVVTVNLLGAATVARHVVPVLRRQGGQGRQGGRGSGDLVLVGSLLGHLAVPEMTAYVVSKWGVRALARQLTVENLDRPGVRVTHVSPGSVDTPIYDHAIDEAGMVNAPPPPTISPERAAAVVLDQVGGRAFRPVSVQTAWTNHALVAAFTLAPAVWDRAVGPAFRRFSRREQHDVDALDHHGQRAR